MKRWIGILALMAATGAALAQPSFTIVRPVDGARIKEKVRVLIPRGSIPPSGYVGVFLDGRFLEALVPPIRADGRFHEYVLDPKGRGIPDTRPGQPIRLELVLYVDFNEQPRIVDRSSVDIHLARTSGINIPPEGITMRYRFTPGREMVYTMQQRTVVSAISEGQTRLGGRPAELPVQGETIRLLYAVDNVFAENNARFPDGLLRMQALPARGRTYADLTVSGATTPARFFDFDMAPIYMRVRPSGEQVFGSIPPYVPLEGTTGGGNRLDLFASFPLPTLPLRPVRPGDSWASRFQNGAINLDELHEVTSVVRTFPARGEFVGVEWESGHPCAKIQNVIDVGTRSIEDRRLVPGVDGLNDQKLTVTETVWFALDIGQVVRVVRDTTIETRGTLADAASLFGFTAGAGGAALGGGTGGTGIPGAGGFPGGMPGVRPGFPGSPGGVRGGARERDDDEGLGMHTEFRQQRGGRQGGMNRPGGFPPGGFPPGGFPGGPPPGIGGGFPPGGFPPGGFPGVPGGFGGRQGAAPVQDQIIRIRTQRILTLER